MLHNSSWGHKQVCWLNRLWACIVAGGGAQKVVSVAPPVYQSQCLILVHNRMLFVSVCMLCMTDYFLSNEYR
jgi:hypothetical protein